MMAMLALCMQDEEMMAVLEARLDTYGLKEMDPSSIARKRTSRTDV